jgi:RimJ/RimL family protein N-acetyltransferase
MSTPIKGLTVTLERLTPEHIPFLFQGLGFPKNNKMLDMINGFPYVYTEDDLSNHLFGYLRDNQDLTIYTIKASKSRLGPPSLSDTPLHEDILGIMGYRLNPKCRTIKLDDFVCSPSLQRTYAATEAMYLLLRHLFEGQENSYCRVQATANALNVQARKYHVRVGFTYEGTLRKDNITRFGTHRDTAVSSILDDEWPLNKSVFLAYLLPTNFDTDGKQIRSMQELRRLRTRSSL